MRTVRTTLIVALALAIISPMLAAEKVVEPFNGKDLSGWQHKGKSAASHWSVGEPSLDPANPRVLVVKPGGNCMCNQVPPHSVDIYTEEKFGDAIIDVELMVPKGSNSGVYMMGEYEIQVLDSFGQKKPGKGDMGALYGIKPPDASPFRTPGEWQHLVIEYRAPKFDAEGKKTANGRIVKATLNGEVIQQDVDIPHPTGGGVTGKEHPTGPVMFQGNHGPVAFRNIKITVLSEK